LVIIPQPECYVSPLLVCQYFLIMVREGTRSTSNVSTLPQLSQNLFSYCYIDAKTIATKIL